MYFKFLLVLFFIYNVQTQNAKNKGLEVEVLYESLCPDSLGFITQQLYPAWKEFGPHINVKFVPFGKSDSIDDGKISFECQHGPRECDGNKLQSCALKDLQDQNLQVHFVNCFMKNFGHETHINEAADCFGQVGLDTNTIAKCFGSEEGTNLQLEAEVRTKEKRPISRSGKWFVPTILFNGQYHQQLQSASLVNFGGVLRTLLFSK